MNLTLKTENGVTVTAPEQKFLLAILVTMAEHQPEQFAKVLLLVDNKVDAYATIPASVQRALTV